MDISFAKKTELRLQYTGRLQYIPTVVVSLPFLLVELVAQLLGHPVAALPFAVVALVLLAWVAFDLVAVKCNLHPRERLPHRNDGPTIFDLMRVRRACRWFQRRKLTPFAP